MSVPNSEHPRRPAEIVGQRVKQARKRRGWTQEGLAKVLTEYGYPMGRVTVVKLETGKERGVSLDDLFALAAVLGVAPVHLLVPLEDDASVAVTPGVTVDAPHARAWIRGELMLPLSPEFQLRELPESELRKIVEEHVGTNLDREMFPNEFASKVEESLAAIRDSDVQREDALTDEEGAVNDG